MLTFFKHIFFIIERDEHLKVWVSELNALGNLNGIVGEDAALKCNAECTSSFSKS